VKRNYARTNKNNAVQQMTLLERREHALQQLTRNLKTKDHLPRAGAAPSKSRRTVTVEFHESEPLPATPPDHHHHISHSRNFPVNVVAWLASNCDDPTTEVWRMHY